MSRPQRPPTRDELLQTIEICRRSLPPDACLVHFHRLDYIEDLIRRRERLISPDHNRLGR